MILIEILLRVMNIMKKIWILFLLSIVSNMFFFGGLNIFLWTSF